MRRIAEKVVAEYPVRALAAVHRVGELAVGDLAVIVAVSCPHRGEAFEACRKLIDDLKHEVPIWKHQKFSDGTEEWVLEPVRESAYVSPASPSSHPCSGCVTDPLV